MQLTLHPSAGVVRSFWVTRRQWLALLDAVTALRLPDEAPPDTVAAAVPGANKRLPAAALDKAVPLQSLRLRPTADGGAKLASAEAHAARTGRACAVGCSGRHGPAGCP